jgi:polyisoprenoid-binding protein YceI
MRKRRIFITLLLIVVFAVIGLVLWFTRDIEAEDNKLSIPETISDRIYLIDSEQSTLNFTIESDIDDIAGSFDIIGHRFEFVADEALSEWRVILVLDIDGTSIDTGSGVYDFLIETGFNVERYPIGRFVGESETTVSELEGVHELSFVGQLELRGVIQDYTVLAHINIDGDILTGSATTQIDVQDFGVDFPSAIASNILEANISVIATESDEPIDQPDQMPSPSPEPSE